MATGGWWSGGAFDVGVVQKTPSAWMWPPRWQRHWNCWRNGPGWLTTGEVLRGEARTRCGGYSSIRWRRQRQRAPGGGRGQFLRTDLCAVALRVRWQWWSDVRGIPQGKAAEIAVFPAMSIFPRRADLPLLARPGRAPPGTRGTARRMPTGAGYYYPSPPWSATNGWTRLALNAFGIHRQPLEWTGG